MRAQWLILPALLLVLLVSAGCMPVGTLPASPTEEAPGEPAGQATPAGDGASPLPTPESPITSTVTAPPVAEPTAAITGTAPITPTVEAPPSPALDMTTYRDEIGGYELDYPTSWSLTYVEAATKLESVGYSVTLTSWQPVEPGSQGIPEGGSKIDIGVTKAVAGGTAPETPLEQAVAARRQEIEQGGGQIVFEEPWTLTGGVEAIHWTVQPTSGSLLHEVIAVFNGNRVVLSGVGDAMLFEQIAMTLRPLGTELAVGAVAGAGPREGQPEPPAVVGPAATASDVAATATPEQVVGGAEPTVEAPAAGAPTVEAPTVEAPAAGAPTVEAPTVDAAATPAAGAAEMANPQSLAGTTYVIRTGDTLARIAARFGVTVRAILQANPQITNADRIYVGQRITIPTGGSQQPGPQPTRPPASTTTRVQIYMVSLGDGSVGCGDGLVAVQRDVPRTAAPLTAALNLLLAQRGQYYGESGLYNALYQSNLRVAGITKSGSTWTVQLAGDIAIGGACDAPRLKAQLEQTALQFSTVQNVRFLVNGQPLDTVLSTR